MTDWRFEAAEKAASEALACEQARAAAAAAAEGSVLEEFDGVSLLLSAKSSTGASYTPRGLSEGPCSLPIATRILGILTAG